MNYKMMSYVLGWVIKIEGICMMLPVLCGICFREYEMMGIFALCILACLAFGQLLSLRKPAVRTLYAREGFVIVGLSWILMSIFGALPFYVSGWIPSFIHAFFETVSGFTTTGASILQNVEILPKCLIFWRSFTHWIGGMGVLVFLLAILPLSGGGGSVHLIKAESPGPAVSKLVPRVQTTAKILYGIYIGLTLLEIVLLLFGGMNLFDSLTVTFGTAGTGGFGVRNDSIASYSPYCQVVITVFMLIFGVDFALYHLLLLRNVRPVFKSAELRGYLGVVFVSILLITLNCRHLYASFGETLRAGAFQVASLMTTTGYSTVDYELWPAFSKGILILVMFIGACAGSTGGGIKVSRIQILFKSILKQIRITTSPREVVKITLGDRPVAHETVRAVNVFIASYLFIFAFSVLLISLDNLDFTSNFTAVLATINNIGPGFSAVGPTCNFSVYSPLSLFILAMDMLIGRLEIFPIIILFSPHTWKK